MRLRSASAASEGSSPCRKLSIDSCSRKTTGPLTGHNGAARLDPTSAAAALIRDLDGLTVD